ncbi:hypothetical protein KCTCHS21_50570 [Cohnella abietis]|uniref:Uncharacterized protein n=1 Tax=Cohnella abietis TaxID=2507935 RepID=A0A3T1DCH1_9BACL|nr:hypothetical protein KCTCHS21_50570 [Cohnella abietis]
MDYKENFKFELASDDDADDKASGKNKKWVNSAKSHRFDPFFSIFNPTYGRLLTNLNAMFIPTTHFWQPAYNLSPES